MDSLSTLSIALFASIGAVLAVIGSIALRGGPRPLGYWLFGWAVFLFGACLSLGVPETSSLRPVSYLFGSLVAPLMVLGAHAHTNRPTPTWVLLVGFLLGVSRLVFFQIGMPFVAALFAATIEPAFGLFAAFTVWRFSPRRNEHRSLADSFLVVGFVAFSIVEALDASSQIVGMPLLVMWAPWSIVGLPLFSLQAALYIHRLGNAAEGARETEAYARRLNILAESARDLIIEADDQGTILYASANIGKETGYPTIDLIGRNAFEILEVDEDSPALQSLREHGRITEDAVAASLPETNRVIVPDGSERWFESTGTTYRSTSNELRILVCTRDVTERRARENRIERNERRLAHAERIASLGSWEYDPETNKVYCSTEMLRLFGLPEHQNEIDRAEIESMVPPDDLDRIFARSNEMDRRRPTFEIVYRIQRPNDGEIRYIRTVGERDFGENDEPGRMNGASMDVTKQVELENTLRRGEEHLRTLVDSNIVGVFYFKGSGEIHEANDAFLSALGYSQEDLPLDWMEISPEDEPSRTDKTALKELERTGVALPFEKTFHSRSGERIMMLIGAARLGPRFAMAIAVDMSERVRAEAYIARYQKELEETIAIRTNELIESRGRLAEADRLAAVGTLAAGVAHQINNPIGAILNSTEYALLCRDDEDSTRVFEEALQANLVEARRCARIVKSMLLFSRDEPTAKWSEDLNRVIRRAHRAIAPYADDHDSIVLVNAPTSEIRARISPIEIEQAIVNILRNAIESRDSGATISVTLRQVDKSAEIEILDNGRGFNDEARENLFVPFYSTRTRAGGTGLGLSVAHGIITDHGGEIRIDSILGEGTRAVILLPILEGEVEGNVE